MSKYAPVWLCSDRTNDGIEFYYIMGRGYSNTGEAERAGSERAGWNDNYMIVTISNAGFATRLYAANRKPLPGWQHIIRTLGIPAKLDDKKESWPDASSPAGAGPSSAPPSAETPSAPTPNDSPRSHHADANAHSDAAESTGTNE